MYYLNSRYYNPEWGRFINADVYVSTGQGMTGANMFAYCGNDPLNRVDVDGKLWEELPELKNRFLFTLEIMGRIVASPFKAMTAEAGAGIGIGADFEKTVNGVPVGIGACTSIVDSVVYDCGQLDVRNTTSTELEANFLNSIEIGGIHGKQHSYFSDDCTCSFMNTSFGDKSKCEANKDISSANSTYGFSAGAFFIFGVRISVTIDLKKWNDELTEIFKYGLSYGTR